MKSKLFTSLLCLFFGLTLMAQTKISGVVSDKQGVLAGVTVMEEGNTANGTVTDDNGVFTLSVKAGATIVVTSIGYKDQSIAVGKQTNFQITLEEDIELLEETVVVGYGVQKKSDVTGSVSSVDAESMMKKTPVDVVQGLQGAAAGVVITQSSGDPTGGYNIRIRGVATMNGDTNPLWVVDGVQYGTSSNLSWLDPQDIANLEILKDASATAIYGARGANGVILVTTKKGKAGKVRVDFRASAGISVISKKLDMADMDEFLSAYRQAIAADNKTAFLAFNGQYDDKLNYIDWQDQMTQTSYRQQYNLSISGGSESVRTNFSVGYMDNKGIVVNSWNRRLTIRLNTDFTIRPWLKAGASMNFNTGKGKGGGNLLDYAQMVPTMDYVDRATGQLVNVPVKYPDGTFGHYMFNSDVKLSGGEYANNPYWDKKVSKFKRDYDEDNGNLRTSAWAEITIIKGLTFRTNLNYDFYGKNSWTYSPAYINNFYDFQQTKGQATDKFSTNGSASTNMGAENYLTYDKEIKRHHFTVMVGQSASKTHGSWNNSSTKDLSFDFLRGFYSTNASDYNDGNGAPNMSTRFLSYFARLNYAYDSRYMLTATVRRDGSSNFGKSNRWGTFPSFSLRWNAAQEKFVKDLGIFDNLSLRVGWGQTGNANVDPLSAMPQLSADGISFDTFNKAGDYNQQVGIAQTKEIDTALKWETSQQTNIGLDFGLMHNSLTVSLDYYIRKSKDLLLNKTIRPSAGFSSIMTNFGSIENKGFEFAIGYKKQFNKDWFFSANLTGSTNKNKAVDVGAGTTNTIDGRTNSQSYNWDNSQVCYNGLALGTYNGYRVDHIIQSQSEIDELNAKAVAKFGQGSYYQKQGTAPGDFLFKDINGDGHVNEQDKEYLGDGFAKLNYGLNLSASFRNWDLTVYTYGALGQKILSFAKRDLSCIKPSNDAYLNVLSDVARNSWTESNPNAKYPRITQLDNNVNSRCSDYFVENGNFLKISNIQIGYTFSKATLHGVLSNARVSFSIQNLCTISPYSKYGDPEIHSGVTTTGLDTGRYPFPRTFMLGLQLGF